MSEKNDSKHSPSSLLHVRPSFLLMSSSIRNVSTYQEKKQVHIFMYLTYKSSYDDVHIVHMIYHLDLTIMLLFPTDVHKNMNIFFRIRVGRILTRFAISRKIIESHEFNMRNRRDAGSNDITALFLKKVFMEKKHPFIQQIYLFDLFVPCLQKSQNS